MLVALLHYDNDEIDEIDIIDEIDEIDDQHIYFVIILEPLIHIFSHVNSLDDVDENDEIERYLESDELVLVEWEYDIQQKYIIEYDELDEYDEIEKCEYIHFFWKLNAFVIFDI